MFWNAQGSWEDENEDGFDFQLRTGNKEPLLTLVNLVNYML